MEWADLGKITKNYTIPVASRKAIPPEGAGNQGVI